jgi:signal transduction histidine kinase
MFEAFTQADTSLERTTSGLGLGLALARQIVEAHGGRISAASAGRDQGSRFTVRLPLA